jgi:hypothetical protein
MRLYQAQESDHLVVLLAEIEGNDHLSMEPHIESVVGYLLRHLGRPLSELLILVSDPDAPDQFARVTLRTDDERLHTPEWRAISFDEVAALVGEAPSMRLWNEKNNGSWVCAVGPWRGVAFPQRTAAGGRWASHVLNKRARLTHSGPAVPTLLAARMWVLDIIANMSRENELWPGENTPVWNEQDDDAWP